MLGEIHAAHAAFADACEDQVAIRDHASDERIAGSLWPQR